MSRRPTTTDRQSCLSAASAASWPAAGPRGVLLRSFDVVSEHGSPGLVSLNRLTWRRFQRAVRNFSRSEAGLDREHDWDDLLSLGEQQLLAVTRLILAAPQFAFLDRPHTTLTREQVKQVLGVLSERAITYLTIGDGNASPDAYDAVLELGAAGRWEWKVTAREPRGART